MKQYNKNIISILENRIACLGKRLNELESSGGSGPASESMITTTLTELNDTLIPNNELVPGIIYKVLDIHSGYNQRAFPVNGYFMAVSTNRLDTNGVGEFIEPNYNNVSFFSRTELNGAALLVGYYAWGNKVYQLAGNVTFINEFNLGGDATLINSTAHPDFETVYETNYDEIYYDLEWDVILGRYSTKTNVKVSRTRNGYSDLELIEYIKFNHDIIQTLEGKTTVVRGFVNVEIVDSFIYPNLINFSGLVNTAYVGPSCELSIESETKKPHRIENMRVIGEGSYAYFYFENTRPTFFNTIKIETASGLDYYAEVDANAEDPFSRVYQDIVSEESSYISINDIDALTGGGIIKALGASSIQVNRPSGSDGISNIVANHNSEVNAEITGTLQYLTLDNNCSFSSTVSTSITSVSMRNNASVTNNSGFNLSVIDIVGFTLDLSTIAADTNSKIYSGLTP